MEAPREKHFTWAAAAAFLRFLPLSVDVKSYSYSSDTQAEGVNLLPPPQPLTHSFFFLSWFFSYYFLLASIVSFYDQPSLCSSNQASLPPSGL